MTAQILAFYFASTYGSGAYNSDNYNGSAGGHLVSTGVLVAGIVTLASLILLTALVVRIWRRPKKALVAETVEQESANK